MKKKKKRASVRRFFNGLYRGLVAVSAVIVTLFVAYKLAVRPPKIKVPPPILPPGSTSTPAPTNEAVGLQRRELTYTFLLVAEDQVSASTDTIIVATYDVPNKKVSLVSVPRDTLVDRKVGPYRYHKINGAYSNAETYKPGSGIAELRDAVSALLGIPIDYYVMVDVPSFIRIVDAVGGVDFEVPVKMNYDAPDQDLHIHYEPKLYKGLMGKQVMEIARCRKNSAWKADGTYTLSDAYPDAEIGRTRTQQGLLKAIAKKLLSWNSVPKITKLAGIVMESVKTDLPADAILYFAENSMGLDPATGLATATFPGRGDVTYRGVDYCYQYDKPAALEMINAMLNPYTTEVTGEMVKMIQVK